MSEDFLGKLKMDIEVIHDNPNKDKFLLDWTIKEYHGIEAFADAELEARLTNRSDLVEGDTIYFPGFFGEIVCMTIEGTDPMVAGNEACIAWLEFGADDRSCWVVAGQSVRPERFGSFRVI